MEKITCFIKEDSWLARRAARQLGAPRAAIVWGRTIHLHGVGRQAFLASERWVRHEVCHIKQYRQYGIIRFVWLYLLEHWRRGYWQNRFEVAARRAEDDPGILEGVEIAG
ncbi:DUF4157 domain-containing protein [Chitinophaga japonensis]|uniref:DUF4157 domain-containing protein n=1 Tax=Chitinophaga japonensis TaxID=104662 RepID=A0A562TD75_CHIJA|nr:DUF4157 domain-containing protein [Chitinophaga japonensis]TWI91228.1 hypothetical protein LX66_0593 [Chitinophaga japonensis]